MGKRGKRGNKPAEKKAILKRLDGTLTEKLEEELSGADLFAKPPPTEDCPICFDPLPRMADSTYYQGCCGKFICEGCYEENAEVIERLNTKKGKSSVIYHTCPFCRALEPTGEKYLLQLKERTSQGDGQACTMVGKAFEQGFYGLAVDKIKALYYMTLAVEFGSAEACEIIAHLLFDEGRCISNNKKLARMLFEIGALRGNISARQTIGMIEYELGNFELGIRHWKIAAEAGHQLSLDCLKSIFSANSKLPGNEFISKEELDQIYRMCHEAQEAERLAKVRDGTS